MLKFHPEPGTILICNFDGFKEPEMVKARPVVVVSPRLKRRHGLLTVAPLSTLEPEPCMGYHCRVELLQPLPEPFTRTVMWVKADMIYNVGFHRLGLVRTGRDSTGKRKYLTPKLSRETMVQIQTCMLVGLGMQQLTIHL